MASLPPGVEIRGDRSPPNVAPATRGRGLFATRRFEPGEAIAVFSSPLVVFPASRDAQSTCNNCLDLRRQPVKLCTGCHAVAYCGNKCQRAHWARCHKVECKALHRALESAAMAAIAASAEGVARLGSAAGVSDEHVDQYVQPLPTPVRALLLLLLQWDKAPAVRAAVERLESNTVAFVKNAALWDDFKMQAAAACQFAGWSTTEQVQTAVEVMCRIHTNSFDRSDHDIGQSGMFLDAALAMVNHACIPAAVVAFAGQKAYLRAQVPIEVGDEITISYIDYTKPRSARQHGLTLYNFTCTCPRCAEDLDIYQVCQRSPLLDLNAGFSLVPDLDLPRSPPVIREDSGPRAVTPQQIEAMYTACQVEQNTVPGDRLRYMRFLWTTCQPLVRARRWAVEPLAHVFRHAIMYYTDQGNYAHVLAFACFGAQHIDPYKYPAPFAQWRLKGLMMIAKTIPHIMPLLQALAEGGRPDPRVHPDVLAALPDLADGALYEALVLIVLQYGPKGHSDEWPPLDAARQMLADVQSGPDHGVVTAALARWLADPASPEMRKFFNMQFVSTVSKLSAVALEILEGLMKE